MRAKQNSTGAAFFLSLHLTPKYVTQKQQNMKRTICKECNPNRETIIGVETHCSECGTPLITISHKNN